MCSMWYVMYCWEYIHQSKKFECMTERELRAKTTCRRCRHSKGEDKSQSNECNCMLDDTLCPRKDILLEYEATCKTNLVRLQLTPRSCYLSCLCLHALRDYILMHACISCPLRTITKHLAPSIEHIIAIWLLPWKTIWNFRITKARSFRNLTSCYQEKCLTIFEGEKSRRTTVV